LFGRIKERFAGVFVGDAEHLRNEVMSILAEISDDEKGREFNHWIERCEWIPEPKGDYYKAENILADMISPPRVQGDRCLRLIGHPIPGTFVTASDSFISQAFLRIYPSSFIVDLCQVDVTDNRERMIAVAKAQARRPSARTVTQSIPALNGDSSPHFDRKSDQSDWPRCESSSRQSRIFSRRTPLSNLLSIPLTFLLSRMPRCRESSAISFDLDLSFFYLS
jgi:hypothetical protein